MIEKITDSLKQEFTEFTFKSDKDDENKKATITAQKDWTKGFDIDIALDSNDICISYSSKVRSLGFPIAIGITFLLTYLFGGSILTAFGLVTDGGTTMKLFYIIPILIFLIPSVTLIMMIASKINPKDEALLESVKDKLTELGYESTIE
ncbi:MAG: hypothetical protein GY754_07295 [bacterium]|nr:hypothetical protein [bacterium]